MDGEDRESLDGTGDSGHESHGAFEDWDVERPANETYLLNDGVRCGAWAEAGQHLTRICQRTGVRPDTTVTPVRAPDFNTPTRLLLRNALDGGVITAAHHDEQLRRQRGDGGRVLKAPSICRKGQTVSIRGPLWAYAAGPFSSKGEARSAIKTVCDADNAGNWRTNREGSKELYRCDEHVHCPVLLSIRRDRYEGTYDIHVLHVAHSLETVTKKRKNSAMNRIDEIKVLEMLGAGKSPQAICNTFASEALEEAKSSGATVDKHKDGGFNGALRTPNPCLRIEMCTK